LIGLGKFLAFFLFFFSLFLLVVSFPLHHEFDSIAGVGYW
jgi:hypothetical protein